MRFQSRTGNLDTDFFSCRERPQLWGNEQSAQSAPTFGVRHSVNKQELPSRTVFGCICYVPFWVFSDLGSDLRAPKPAKISETWVAEINRRCFFAKEARKVAERVEQEVSQHLIEQQKASEVPVGRWLDLGVGNWRKHVWSTRKNDQILHVHFIFVSSMIDLISRWLETRTRPPESCPVRTLWWSAWK